MPKTSKIIEGELVLKAEKALSKIGNEGVVAVRLKAIIASSKHGIKKVAEVYDINRASLHRWAALFRDNGVEGIRNVGKPSRSKLSMAQKEEVVGLINADRGITIKKLKILIKERFDIDIEKSSIHRMLKSLGFSHITGRKRHYKSNESSKEEFKKKPTKIA
jgi:transposase